MVCNSHRTIPFCIASSTSGRPQSLHKTTRSYTSHSSHSISRRAEAHLICQGGQVEKRRVSPRARGSCMAEGQTGWWPVGNSMTRSTTRCRLRLHCWVMIQGQMNMWSRCRRFCLEVLNLSITASPAAGEGTHNNHCSATSVGCQRPHAE